MENKIWTVTQKAGYAVTVHISIPHMASGWEQYFLLRSDVHGDSIHSRTDLEIKHLDQCRTLGAGILDFGDLFDAMQSPFDPRQSKSELREENKRTDYFNSLIESNVRKYAPYAENFVLLSHGNHETKVLSRAGIDLTSWLVNRLRAEYHSPVVAGGYSGWVRFLLTRDRERHTRRLWYTHGYGAGGEVTKNVIQLSGRTPNYIENADIHVCGHVHNQWYMCWPRIRLNEFGKIEKRVCHFVQLPTYKDEYGLGQGGFAVERGFSPRPVGAWWLIFRYNYRKGVDIEVRKTS